MFYFTNLSLRHLSVISLASLSLLSHNVHAQPTRHIADPLNLTTNLGFGFDADVLKVGGRLGGESQSVSVNSNFSGDKWSLAYLYAPNDSNSNWNITSSINRGKTDTEQGRFSHYQYQLGVINEFKGWLETAVFTEFAANYLEVKDSSTHNSLAAKAKVLLLKPWSERWYNQFSTELAGAIDGTERIETQIGLSLGYRISEQWSWELGYQYQKAKIDGVDDEETKWLLGFKSQF